MGLDNITRTETTINDHNTLLNRIIHGDGYLQFRGKKPEKTAISPASYGKRMRVTNGDQFKGSYG